MIKNIYLSPCKVPLYLSEFNETWIFSTVLRKILKYNISWKSVQWEPICSIRTDGRTDMTQLIVAFRNFANPPNKKSCVWPRGLELSWNRKLTSLYGLRRCSVLGHGTVISNNGGSRLHRPINRILRCHDWDDNGTSRCGSRGTFFCWHQRNSMKQGEIQITCTLTIDV